MLSKLQASMDNMSESLRKTAEYLQSNFSNIQSLCVCVCFNIYVEKLL